jgi:hypothetical protein
MIPSLAADRLHTLITFLKQFNQVFVRGHVYYTRISEDLARQNTDCEQPVSQKVKDVAN